MKASRLDASTARIRLHLRDRDGNQAATCGQHGTGIRGHFHFGGTALFCASFQMNDFFACRKFNHIKTRSWSQKFQKKIESRPDVEELELMDASEIYSKETQCKGSDISQRKWKNHFPSRRWTNQTFWSNSFFHGQRFCRGDGGRGRPRNNPSSEIQEKKMQFNSPNYKSIRSMRTFHRWQSVHMQSLMFYWQLLVCEHVSWTCLHMCTCNRP